MADKQNRKSGGAKKYGRMKEWCARYKANNVRGKNKRRKAHKEEVKAAKLARKRARRAGENDETKTTVE